MNISACLKKTVSACVIALCTFLTAFSQQHRQERDEILLWDGSVPGGPGPSDAEIVSEKGSVTHISRPRLIIHYPKHANGTAILVISGGGYAHIETGKESRPAAEWLASQGITACELIYRLPAEGWSTPEVPFQDGQRAMRLLRYHAAEMGIDTGRIGVMGFSAGGHLAAMLITQPDRSYYAPADDIDRVTARPDFAGLIYPVISMLPPYNHTHSEKELLGKYPGRRTEEAFSPQLHADSYTPPVFLAHAADDAVSPVQNSSMMYQTLQRYGTRSELHVFPTGGHGWGLGKPGTPETAWPDLFMKWERLLMK